MSLSTLATNTKSVVSDLVNTSWPEYKTSFTDWSDYYTTLIDLAQDSSSTSAVIKTASEDLTTSKTSLDTKAYALADKQTTLKVYIKALSEL